MIQRDEHGIICQHTVIDTHPIRYSLDGGDSANRTAIMALCGSEKDIELLPKFIINGKLVRHPYQERWNKPELTSRDQLVPVLAALDVLTKMPCEPTLEGWLRYDRLFIDKHWLLWNYAWRINKDILWPHHRLAAGLWLKADIYWNTKVRPWHEQNQIICVCIAAGPEYVKLYKRLHPDYKKALREYWAGWRDQAEIGEALIRKMESI